MPATPDVDTVSFCATHSMSVREDGWDHRWTDAEIKDQNDKDQAIVGRCFS